METLTQRLEGEPIMTVEAGNKRELFVVEGLLYYAYTTYTLLTGGASPNSVSHLYRRRASRSSKLKYYYSRKHRVLFPKGYMLWRGRLSERERREIMDLWRRVRRALRKRAGSFRLWGEIYRFLLSLSHSLASQRVNKKASKLKKLISSLKEIKKKLSGILPWRRKPPDKKEGGDWG